MVEVNENEKCADEVIVIVQFRIKNVIVNAIWPVQDNVGYCKNDTNSRDNFMSSLALIGGSLNNAELSAAFLVSVDFTRFLVVLVAEPHH